MINQPPPYRLMTDAERRRYWLGMWRLAVPGLMVLLAIVAMTLPLPMGLPLFPHLALLAVFLWALLQPALMPPIVAFVAGVVADIAFAQPIGVNATIFALTAGGARLFERWVGEHGLLFDWAVAAALMLVMAVLAGAFMMLAGRPVPLVPLLLQAVVTCLAYPPMVWACASVHRRVFGRAQ